MAQAGREDLGKMSSLEMGPFGVWSKEENCLISIFYEIS
jgi:hypothetical protein